MSEIDPVLPIPRASEFYNGRTVFLTGFSGFLGRCTVEKIMWTAPGIKRIYILMRSRRNASIEKRVDDITSSDCFMRLRERDPSFKDKIVAVSGDALLPNLGLSPEDRDRIVSEVSVIIHGAATVRFDETLSMSIDINIKGTKALLDLALTMPHLKVFTHISTAYTNCNRKYVCEQMYPPLADWKETLFIRDNVDPYVLNTVMNKYKGRTPNTYTFTKNVAEHMVYEYGDRLPIVILRPSIVTGALEEPFPGWFHTLFGAIGVNLGYSTGFLRILLCDPDGTMDYLPCDLFTKSATFTTSLRPYQRKEAKPIYHVTTTNLTPITHELEEYAGKSCMKHPLKYKLWTHRLTFTNNPYLYHFLFTTCQLIPALIIDLLIRLFRQKPFMMNMEKKMHSYTSAYTYFMRNHFIFENSNYYRSEEFMRKEDKAEMHFALQKQEVNYYKLFDDFLVYIGKKFLKQKPEDHDRAATLGKVLKILDKALAYGITAYFAYYVYSRQIIPYLFATTYNFLFNFS